jgi:osmotically-inducible protein OsmY
MESSQTKLADDMNPTETELRNRVLRFLQMKRVPGLERVSADVEGGTVRLHGQVSSFQERALFLECCRHVSGVLKVHDELSVDEEVRQAKRRPVMG